MLNLGDINDQPREFSKIREWEYVVWTKEKFVWPKTSSKTMYMKFESSMHKEGFKKCNVDQYCYFMSMICW